MAHRMSASLMRSRNLISNTNYTIKLGMLFVHTKKAIPRNSICNWTYIMKHLLRAHMGIIIRQWLPLKLDENDKNYNHAFFIARNVTSWQRFHIIGPFGGFPLVTHGFRSTRTTKLDVFFIVSLIKPLYKQLLVIWDTPMIIMTSR